MANRFVVKSSQKQSKLGVKIWGTRGSIAYPSKETIVFGGNTTCFELLYPGSEIILMDGGTGIYPFAQKLIRTRQRKRIGKVHIFLSHLHWDHIQGLPLCALLNRKDAEIHFYSHHPRVLSLLAAQWRYPFFPISWNQIKAKKVGHHLKASKRLSLNNIEISTFALNHPGGALGYKFQLNNKSLAIMTDTEFGRLSKAARQRMSRFLHDTQLLLHDGMYLGRESREYKGYGHTDLNDLTKWNWVSDAPKKDRRHLVVLHHVPQRSDLALRRMRKMIQKKARTIKISMGHEGKTYWVT